MVWVLKVMDYFGLLPKFLLEVSPFHRLDFFTSMGSLGIPPIVHHLYDFGNLPVFCAFGCKYRKNEIDLDGNLVQRKYAWIFGRTDERICDGFYFATALKHMKSTYSTPERLDEPLDEVVKDVDDALHIQRKAPRWGAFLRLWAGKNAPDCSGAFLIRSYFSSLVQSALSISLVHIFVARGLIGGFSDTREELEAS